MEGSGYYISFGYEVERKLRFTVHWFYLYLHLDKKNIHRLEEEKSIKISFMIYLISNEFLHVHLNLTNP